LSLVICPWSFVLGHLSLVICHLSLVICPLFECVGAGFTYNAAVQTTN
jgi:hypothetical protein